jgi:hypothetical protein
MLQNLNFLSTNMVLHVENLHLTTRDGSQTKHRCGKKCPASTHPAIRSRKACKSGGGRKTPQERGEDPLSM